MFRRRIRLLALRRVSPRIRRTASPHVAQFGTRPLVPCLTSSLASPSIRRVFLRSICARRRFVSSLNLARGRFAALQLMRICGIMLCMKMKRLLLPTTVCVMVIAAVALVLFGFRHYVNYCYVALWLERCQPNMTVEDVFSVLPDRFRHDCLLKQVDHTTPYVCFLPSDCSKVEFVYVCRLRSDVDRLFLFPESCHLYFDKNRRLVGIDYCPYNLTLDNDAWEQFIECREPHVPREHMPTNNVVVVMACNKSGVYMPVKDWYKLKDK